MFCGKCGNKLNETEKFCGKCGYKRKTENGKVVEHSKSKVNTKQQPQVLKVEPKIKEKKESKLLADLKRIFNTIKNFIVKHKLMLSIILGVIIVIVVGIFLFFKFYDFTKMSWDEKYGDYKITDVTPTTLSYKVKAYDKDDFLIKDIKYEVTGGKVTADGIKVEWELPKKAGKYTITAIAPSGKKISKTVNVIVLDEGFENPSYLGGMVKDTETSDDLDGDGLTNSLEKEKGTNPELMDTDGDGLSDYYEINESKTDPLLADSDKDGLDDGNELDLELNPLLESTYEDGILDGKRTLKYQVVNPNITIDIEGSGNIASSTIDVYQNKAFDNKKGVLNNIYYFYTSSDIKTATLKINYDINSLNDKNLQEENLKIYNFDDNTKEFKVLETTLDVENKTVSATVLESGKYIIGDSSIVKKSEISHIMLVIDNSVSMYSEEQMIAAGYDNSTGAVGNDTEFKRLTLTNEMIDLFTGNYYFGVAEFSGDYVNLVEFNSVKEDLKKEVNSMKSNWQSNATGTNIIEALNSGISEFEDKNGTNYLVLLTDGKNTEGSLSSNKTSIINKAKENNVHVCVIGLGDVDDSLLKEISIETGCSYYHATNDKALDEIYAIIGADINYNYVDTDADLVTDGTILYDTGFIVTRDGFSFSNYNTKQSDNGHCYGMATFAMLRYMDELPLSLSSTDRKTLAYDFPNALEYNLYNTYFASDKNLYDFEFETEILDIYFDDLLPSDYRDRIEEKVWLINETYYNQYEELGFEIKTKKYPGKEKHIKKVQVSLLDAHANELKENADNDDYQLLMAIYRLFVLQSNDKMLTFNADPDKTYAALVNDLSIGKPTIIALDHDHAVNAIKLIQDSKDANSFKIAVYDNNFPGETRYIHMSRKKFNKVQLNYTAWTNEYQYKFQYDKNGDGTLEEVEVGISYPVVE